MYKQRILVAAIAAAFASAGTLAADVTIYGVVNTGLSFIHADSSVSESTDTFELDSGNYLGNRFGLKGEETISPDLKAGFILENGFSADTGTLSDSGRMFGREASLYLTNETFGTLRFGRMTVMTASTGSSGLMAGKFSAMSTGWGIVWGHNAVFTGKFGRMDNMVMYSSPKFAGLQLHAQYSSEIDQATEKTAEENSGSSTRYMGLGLQYFNGPFSTIAVVDSHRYAATSEDPGVTANGSVAYDFGVAKFFLTGQYFRDMRYLGKAAVDAEVSAANVFGNNVAKDGFALNVGATAPVAGGKLYGAIGWMDAENAKNSDASMRRLTLSAGYDFNLSKRTVVYAGAGYMLDMYDEFGTNVRASNDDAAKYGVTFGLSHRF